VANTEARQGGHYGPIFNDYIEQQNEKNIPGAMEIKLKTVLIGNGWYDPLLQYASYYSYLVDPGNPYDYNPLTTSQREEMHNGLYGLGNCYDQIKYCYESGINEICSYADSFCYNQVEALYDRFTKRDEYDMRELTPDPFPPSFYVQYLNTPHVQAAIGAFQNYSESSSTVGTAFGTTGDDGRIFRILENIRSLLRKGITVMLFVGDADYVCNVIGNEAVADEIGHEGFDEAGYAALETSDHTKHGEVKQAGIFSFVRIYDSGHEVPFYQPLAALEIFERAIAGKDIATGKVTVKDGHDGYRTKGPKRTTYHEGIGTVQFSVIPDTYNYNTTTHVPQPPKMKRGFEGRQRPSKAGKDFKKRAYAGKQGKMGVMKNFLWW
jgi:carboxypeptidase C (cathepsin A)